MTTRALLDGSEFIVRRPGVDFDEIPFFQIVQFADTLDVQRASSWSINVGALDAANGALDAMKGSVTAERRLGAGVVKLAEGHDPSGRRIVGAAWVGEWHSAYLVMQPGYESMEDALEMFDGLLLTDTPDGLFFSSDKWEVSRHVVNTVIPTVGVVNAQRLSFGVVPKHAGAAVPVGELWRTDSAIEGYEHLLLASSTVLAEITPFRGIGNQPLEDPTGLFSADPERNAVDFASDLSELRWASA